MCVCVCARARGCVGVEITRSMPPVSMTSRVEDLSPAYWRATSRLGVAEEKPGSMNSLSVWVPLLAPADCSLVGSKTNLDNPL